MFTRTIFPANWLSARAELFASHSVPAVTVVPPRLSALFALGFSTAVTMADCGLLAFGSAALAKMHDPITSTMATTKSNCLFINSSSIERIEREELHS
jgi:hypothetical protein